jgi:hypothetical protein
MVEISSSNLRTLRTSTTFFSPLANWILTSKEAELIEAENRNENEKVCIADQKNVQLGWSNDQAAAEWVRKIYKKWQTSFLSTSENRPHRNLPKCRSAYIERTCNNLQFGKIWAGKFKCDMKWGGHVCTRHLGKHCPPFFCPSRLSIF